MVVAHSAGRAWGSVAAAVAGGVLWAAAGVVGFLVTHGWLWYLVDGLLVAGGVTTLFAVGRRLRRGGWTAGTAAQSGRGWPQPVLTAGMFTGVLITHADGGAGTVGSVLTIAFALALMIYSFVLVRRKSRTP